MFAILVLDRAYAGECPAATAFTLMRNRGYAFARPQVHLCLLASISALLLPVLSAPLTDSGRVAWAVVEWVAAAPTINLSVGTIKPMRFFFSAGLCGIDH